MRSELNAMIVKKFKPDYKKATKREKSLLLNQLEQLTQISRKHLIKLLRGRKGLISLHPQGRPKIYSDELKGHIIELHQLMERISPKRMKEAIPLWFDSYQRHYGLLSEEIKKELLQTTRTDKSN